MIKKMLISVLLFIMISGVYALGITPGRTILDYSSGAVHEIQFGVINSEGKDIDLVVLIQGELNASISVDEVAIHMNADERDRSLSYTITMPSGLEPGPHSSEIAVIQLPEKSLTSEAFIGATVGVATQVHVFVPYPGKYADAEMNVIGPEDGIVTFAIPINSRGDLDLVRVRGAIDIFGPLNEKITSVQTNEVSIFSGQRNELVAQWNADVKPGPYRAVATVIYDEDTLTLEKEFNVGKRLLELSQIEVNDFSLGEIAKFELLVENKWSQQISGAYAQMEVYNDEGKTMAEFKSATYDIPPLEKVLMVSFWDTAGVRKGTYESSLFLRYSDQSAQRDLELEVSDNDIKIVGVGYVISQAQPGGGGGSLTIVLVTGIVVLIIINLLWFLVLRKKMKK